MNDWETTKRFGRPSKRNETRETHRDQWTSQTTLPAVLRWTVAGRKDAVDGRRWKRRDSV